MHDPLAIVAYVVTQQKVRQQFEPAQVGSGTKPANDPPRLRFGLRARVAGGLRGLANRLEPAERALGAEIRS